MIGASALPAASGLELIHNFSLIHDDIEDNSATRRGRPTLWKAWNLPQALNAGDALLILSHLTSQRLTSAGIGPELALKVQTTIDEGCLRVTLGQHLDLDFEARQEISEEDYLEMIQGKTASLIAASCAAGAMVGGAAPDVVAHFRSSDITWAWLFKFWTISWGFGGLPEITGKPAGDDLRFHKKSLPVVYGLAHCEAFMKLWSLPQPSTSDIDQMKADLEACGALDHAQSTAGQHTDLALEHLDDARPAAPAAQALKDLANRLLTRSR